MPLSPSVLSEAYLGYSEMSQLASKAAQFADDAPQRYFCETVGNFYFILFHPLHQLPQFDKERHMGAGGIKLRAGIDQYDFDSMHGILKSFSTPVDPFLFGHCSMGLLHFCGDLDAAKAGWKKQNYAWRKIAELVQGGEKKWGDYFFEGFLGGYTAVGDMILTNEIDLLREHLSLLPGNLSLHDPLVSKEWVGHLRQSPIVYQSSNGYCFANMDSLLLMDRALNAQ